mgnify:CR=1 FL=1|jgi:hypothetical protein
MSEYGSVPHQLRWLYYEYALLVYDPCAAAGKTDEKVNVSVAWDSTCKTTANSFSGFVIVLAVLDIAVEAGVVRASRP